MLALILTLASLPSGQFAPPPPGWWPLQSTGPRTALWSERTYGLYAGDDLLGRYDALSGLYRPLLGHDPNGDHRWGPPCDPPVGAPCANFGVVAERIGSRADRITYSGEAVGAEQATALIADPQIPDVDRIRVVAVGPASETAAVTAAMASAPELAPYRDKVIYQSYEPTHFHVCGGDGKGLGYKLDGRPAVHVLAPDGLDLGRLDDFSGGAPALAAKISAGFSRLRKPDPNYDPNATPGGASPEGLQGALLALGGLAAGAAYLTKPKGT